MIATNVGSLRCQTDSYLTKLCTKVVSCNFVNEKYEVILQDTILFPTGGGQPHDLGTINNIPVISIERRALQCIHFLNSPLQVHSTVQVVLDWERRLDHMQQVNL
jgi:misacylated tRNA(Ala) deacylase